jgi:transposase-like protein
LPKKPDKAEIASARQFLMKKLEEYDVSREDIAWILGVDISTVRRRPLSFRLARQSSIKDAAAESENAYKIALVLLIRAGFSVSTIGKVFEVSQATVYRWKNCIENMGAVDPEMINDLREQLNSDIDYQAQIKKRGQAMERYYS